MENSVQSPDGKPLKNLSLINKSLRCAGRTEYIQKSDFPDDILNYILKFLSRK